MTAEHARLPAEFSSFVGRAGEVADLARLIQTARAVTLCGAGGIGKTRLALRLLAAIADEFGDGVWFVDLGEIRQAELVPAAIAAVVGVDEEPGRPLAETLADAIMHRQALLVLDNCEHLVGACASICQRLLAGAPQLRVVATSREPLHVAAETVWPVPPLELPPAPVSDAATIGGFDAVRLFAERAAAAAPGFTVTARNAASIARICRALDGLPLAIELAAAWIRVLSAEQIADRLADRFGLLTGTDRSAPARQQTLRATLDWSYDLLSEPEQVLLRRLSVFAELVPGNGRAGLRRRAPRRPRHPRPGHGPDRQVAAGGRVRGTRPGQVPDAGDRPRVRGRLPHRRGRGSRVRAPAARVHGARVRGAGRARHGDRARSVVSAGERVPPGGRRGGEPARGARASCLAHGDADTGLRLCSAIRPVWIVRGAFAEGARWFDAFFALPGAASAPDAVTGPALSGRAQIAMASGSPDAAELAQAALDLCWSAGNHFEAAASLNLLTEIALHAGSLDEASARAGEALAVARSAGDRWNEGYALGTMATVAGFRGNLREAEELGAEALAHDARHRPALGRGPHPARAWRTWPGCKASTTSRAGAIRKRSASCATSARGRTSRAAWPGSAGSRWSRATWRPPAATSPRACG